MGKTRGRPSPHKPLAIELGLSTHLISIISIIDANNREQLGLILLSKTEMLRKVIEDGLADDTKPKDRLVIYMKLNELGEIAPDRHTNSAHGSNVGKIEEGE